MKAYGGCRGIAPLILNIGTRWRLVVNFMPRPLYSVKEPRCPLNRRLDGPQSQSGCFEEEKSVLSLPGFDPQNVQPVA